MGKIMDDDFDRPKVPLLKQLVKEDLSVHSIESLDDRIAILKSEVRRTEIEKAHKKTAHADADSLFN